MDDFKDNIPLETASPKAQMIREPRVTQPALTSELNESQPEPRESIQIGKYFICEIE